MIRPSLRYEYACLARGAAVVIGCDEVGRGCLAGPVVAAAVMMPKTLRRGWNTVIRDSKALSVKQRNEAEAFIKSHAVAWSVSEVDAATIDAINIHHASLEAMRIAVCGLQLPHIPPLEGGIAVLVDGRFVIPGLDCAQEAIVDGDALSMSIAAASIIAKTHRDALMIALHEAYPAYGFAVHKGYATAQHRTAIRACGLTPLHRRTFCGNVLGKTSAEV